MIFGKEIGILEVLLFFFALLAARDIIRLYIALKLKSVRAFESLTKYGYKIAQGALVTAPLLAASKYLPGYAATFAGALYILLILFLLRKWLK